MLEKTPDGLRDSQGQFDLTQWTQHTMDIPGVIQFESAALTDTVCIMGFPEATLYAKSNPSGVQNGPTDTDFFVRIVDVYPDGRELFVVEGCVNARARAYAKSLLMNQEDDNAVFDNINIGEIYEYAFRMLPIAYTFGRQHKIKVLISSSNYTRYQVNPNLPIMPGEFFRRKPGDGQKYTYNGVQMTPRVAINRVAFSNTHPSHISFPIYDQALAGIEEIPTTIEPVDALVVYPNPTTAEALVSVNYSGSFELNITDISGKVVMRKNFTGDQYTVDVQHLSNGMYSINLHDLNTGKRFGNKLIKK